MFKRFALGLAVDIISLGIIFIGLDILDIAGDYSVNRQQKWHRIRDEIN